MMACLYCNLFMHIDDAFLSLYLSMYLYLSVCLYVYLSLSVYLSMYLYLSVYLSVYLYLSLSVCLCLSVCVSLSIFMSVCLCLSVCASLSIFMSVWVSFYIYQTVLNTYSRTSSWNVSIQVQIVCYHSQPGHNPPGFNSHTGTLLLFGVAKG